MRSRRRAAALAALPLVFSGRLSAAVLGHYAGNDDFFTPEAAEALGEQLRGLGKEVEIIVYPGVDHAFFNDTRPEVYNAEAANAVWARSLAFFQAHLT